MSLLLLKLLRKFLKALVSSNTPAQIAMAFSLGAIMGLTPSNLFVSILVMSLLFIFNVNFSAGILSSGLFSLFAHKFYPLAHNIGSYLLIDKTNLHAFWTTLYNMPVLPFLNFNNTVMLGTLILALLAQVPLYFLIKSAVIAYRQHIHEKLNKIKAIQALKASGIGQWVYKIWRVFQ
jgi:uncharacterized protein (TIGR03546 family)